MSSILKALRKVEEEKRAATHAAPDLRSDQGTTASKSQPFLALLAGAFLGVFCLGIFFLFTMEKSEPVQGMKVQVSAEPAAPVAVTPATPVQVQSPREEVIPVVRMPREPVAVTEPVTKKIKKTSRTAATSTAGLAASAGGSTTSHAELEKPIEQPARPVAAKSAPLPVGTSLIVTEIFYHEEAENSMAVVNDLPVMVGTLIDSAIVTAISTDHVVFDIENKSYMVRKSQ